MVNDQAGPNPMKGVLIALIAVVVVALSVTLQPWAELGFGMDVKDLPAWSLPIVNFPPFQSLHDAGASALSHLTKALTSQNDGTPPDQEAMNPLIAGNYTYGLIMAAVMVLASIGIMLIGREDSEEKTMLPQKK